MTQTKNELLERKAKLEDNISQVNQDDYCMKDFRESKNKYFSKESELELLKEKKECLKEKQKENYLLFQSIL